MATKKQISEQAIRILSGGHLKPDRTLDIREVMLHLDQIRDAMVVESTHNNIKNGVYAVDEDYLSFHESIPVVGDAVKGLRKMILPVSTLSLPMGLALYQVSPIGNLEEAFIIITAGQIGLFAGSQALEHELNTYCWQVGEEVYFKTLSPTISYVTAILAASSKSIAENADYPMSPNDEKAALERLINAFSIHQKQPHDEAEDGQK